MLRRQQVVPELPVSQQLGITSQPLQCPAQTSHVALQACYRCLAEFNVQPLYIVVWLMPGKCSTWWYVEEKATVKQSHCDNIRQSVTVFSHYKYT